jgi:hypothetical protein
VSWYLAVCTGCFAVFAVVFIPSTYGSGAIRQNPHAAWAGYLIWFASIVYIWLRVFDERPKSRTLATFIALCGIVAVISVPLQLRALVGDPGHPQPRFRLPLLWPGIIAVVALLGAATGRILASRRSGPGLGAGSLVDQLLEAVAPRRF